MDIGKEKEPFIAEPLRDPFRRQPAPEPEPVEPGPAVEPEPVKVADVVDVEGEVVIRHVNIDGFGARPFAFLRRDLP